MKTKRWLQIAAMASALAIAGTAAATDQNSTRSQEQSGATVNGNAAAQLGTDANGNTAAQPGTDAPKTIGPNEADTTAPKSNVDTSRDSLKHPPTNRMDAATPTEKTPSDKRTAKHPPTARMDAATPNEKSPQ